MKLSLKTILEMNVAQEAKKSGQMVAFYVPFDLAKKLKKCGEPFSGDGVNLKDMHITIGLIRDENKKHSKGIADALKLICHYIEPFEFKITKLGIFPGSESSDYKDVLHALPESSNFQKIHNIIFDVFQKFGIEIDNGDFEFKPHITIKYCKPKQNIDPTLIKINEVKMLDSISFCSYTKIKTFPLGV
jgi:2'-5' RNA ligase